MFHKLFPLRPSAIHRLTATLNVFAHLLLAFVHQAAHLLSGLPGAGAQALGSRPLILLSSAMMNTLLPLSFKTA